MTIEDDGFETVHATGVTTQTRTERPQSDLDAAHEYMMKQYGSSPLSNPVDRARIAAALKAVEGETR